MSITKIDLGQVVSVDLREGGRIDAVVIGIHYPTRGRFVGKAEVTLAFFKGMQSSRGRAAFGLRLTVPGPLGLHAPSREYTGDEIGAVCANARDQFAGRSDARRFHADRLGR